MKSGFWKTDWFLGLAVVVAFIFFNRATDLVAGLDLVPVIGGRTGQERETLPLPQLADDRRPGTGLGPQVEQRGGDGSVPVGPHPGRQSQSNRDRDGNRGQPAQHDSTAASTAPRPVRTHSRLLRVEPCGASSSPTRTCPPRAAAAPASGRMSTASPATIQGEPGASSASSRR